MKLTRFQRVILIVYVIVIINVCIFFAPKSFFGIENGVSSIIPIGYSPIWEISYSTVKDEEATTKAVEKDMEARGYNQAYSDPWERLIAYTADVPPEDRPVIYKTEVNPYIRIDYYRMTAEAFTVTVIAGVLLVLTMPKKEG